MRYLDAVPETVRVLHAELENSGFFDGADSLRHGARALLTDIRMQRCWETLASRCDPDYRDETGYDWAQSFWIHAVYAFDAALVPQSRWSQKTLREQTQWLSDFTDAIDRVKSLLEQAPLPDSETARAAFPFAPTVLDRWLMEAKATADPDRPALDWLVNRIHSEDELEEVLEPTTYHFSAVLDHYAREQLRAARINRQALKKPRDSKATRAKFLQSMTDWCGLVCGSPMQDIVATTAAVVLQDEAITPRLVRTHTSSVGRADSPRTPKNPASSDP